MHARTVEYNPKDASTVEVKYLKSANEAVKAGNTVSPAKTRAIGCGIKWKS